MKDVTARKESEARLGDLLAREQSARLEAERVNRVKDEFLATLSTSCARPERHRRMDPRHAHGQPGRGDHRARHRDHRAEREPPGPAHLDILDVSRIVAGKLRLELRAVDLREVIHEAMET